MEKVDREMFFSLSLLHNTRTQGVPMQLNIGRFRTDKIKDFFTSAKLQLAVMATNLAGSKR